jgi:hypothetical protein
VGATTASTGAFTTLAYTGTLTGGTGVINIGSGQLYKDASGNVGIGTSSPGAIGRALNVFGAADNVSTLALEGNNGAKFLVGYSGSGSDSAAFFANDAIRFGYATAKNATGFVERMRITSAGNVGIGTSSPASSAGLPGLKLHVGSPSSATAQLILEEDEGDFELAVVGETFRIYDDGTERMRIDSAGNVGIGTSSPTGGKLQVNHSASEPGVYILEDNAGLELHGVANFGGKIAANAITFNTGSGRPERMRIDSSGNLLIGGTSKPTASVGNLVMFNGTAPTGNVTNGCTLFCEDVSSSSELKVRDEAGNVTTLSPHNFSVIPEGPSENMAWSYYSERDGKRINVDMLKAIRLLEKLSGEKLVHII